MADVTRSARDRSTVRDLLARGLPDREVSAISGVPPVTVGRWRRSWPAIEIRWRPAHEQSYAYLLGLYLGDGCVLVSKRGQVLLRICLDAGYPAVIDDAWTAMQLSVPHARAHVYQLQRHPGGQRPRFEQVVATGLSSARARPKA